MLRSWQVKREPNDVVKYVKFSVSMVRQIEELANTEHTTQASIIRQAVDMFLSSKLEGLHNKEV